MEQKEFVNEVGTEFAGMGDLGRLSLQEAGTLNQQRRANTQRRGRSFWKAGMVAVLVAVSVPLGAQTVDSASTAKGNNHWVSDTIRPALAQVGEALGGVDVRRWKVHREVRGVMNGNIESIQRDLSGTLAGLLQQADAEPGSVPAAFAVYRNVDALYDTLLRVVETAGFTAPREEAEALQAALNRLEGARSALGDGILSGAKTQQAEVIRLRSALVTALEHQQVRTTVVESGPERSREERQREEERRRHHAVRAKHYEKKAPPKKPVAKKADEKTQPKP